MDNRYSHSKVCSELKCIINYDYRDKNNGVVIFINVFQMLLSTECNDLDWEMLLIQCSAGSGSNQIVKANCVYTLSQLHI